MRAVCAARSNRLPDPIQPEVRGPLTSGWIGSGRGPLTSGWIGSGSRLDLVAQTALTDPELVYAESSRFAKSASSYLLVLFLEVSGRRQITFCH